MSTITVRCAVLEGPQPFSTVRRTREVRYPRSIVPASYHYLFEHQAGVIEAHFEAISGIICSGALELDVRSGLLHFLGTFTVFTEAEGRGLFTLLSILEREVRTAAYGTLPPELPEVVITGRFTQLYELSQTMVQ